ncbi:hypothetical protein Acid345_3395 [Candidatus Koribacter versatilis Ellin345]|uniref:Uncharacterized protein n=1 Tax=Koribacter versatilis (strain Ellin345) TaxID=204669 RepID=Q1IL54_KORVE|nr:hypothetical protein [Candidatus Koribacter versatilis]ABF42396.1 hypothetical protein Acid345_3395 [Candidatus Koribacter versatilis Ellin345]
MLRRIFALSFLLFSAVALMAQSKITLNGNIQQMTGEVPSSRIRVKVDLIQCAPNLPRVSGVAIIGDSSKSIAPDGSGNFTTLIWPNPTITCDTLGNSNYQVSITKDQATLWSAVYHIATSPSTQDLSTLTPVAVTVVSPYLAGHMLLHGTAAPSSGDGNDNDFFLNTTASCLYGPKASGAWPGSCTSIIGPPGAGNIASLTGDGSGINVAGAATITGAVNASVINGGSSVYMASTSGTGSLLFPFIGFDSLCDNTGRTLLFGPGHYRTSGCDMGSSFGFAGVVPFGDGTPGTGAVLHYTGGGHALGINPASVGVTTNKFFVRDIAIDGTGSSSGIRDTFAYSSGGTATGTGKCLATTTGGGGSGGTATVAVASGVISGNLTILTFGQSYTGVPSSWNLSLPASGAASSCSGTITTTGGAIAGADAILAGNTTASVKSANGVFQNVLVTNFPNGAGIHCVACEIMQLNSIWSSHNKYGYWFDGVGTNQINTNIDMNGDRASSNQIGIYATQLQDFNIRGGDVEYNAQEGIKLAGDANTSVQSGKIDGVRLEGNQSSRTQTSWSLTSLACASSVLTGQTSTSHTMSVGDPVAITGSTGPSDYNVNALVASVPDNTHFTISIGCSTGSASPAGSISTAWSQLYVDGASLLQGITLDGLRFYTTVGPNIADEWIGAVGGVTGGASVQRGIHHSSTSYTSFIRSTSSARMWFQDENPSTNWSRPSAAVNVCFEWYDNSTPARNIGCNLLLGGTVAPSAAGGGSVGTAALPFGNAYFGGAATNNFHFNLPSFTAARTLYVPDANSTAVVPDTGASHNYLTAVSATGVISKAQPAFTDISGTAATTQIATGTPAAGSYPDGGTGAWTPLPVTQSSLIYQTGPIAEQIGNASDQTVWTVAMPAIPAGKCVQADVYLYHSVSSSASVAYKFTYGSSSVSTSSSNSTTNSQIRLIMKFCNNAGVQNAQWVIIEQPFVGGTAIGSTINTTTSEDLSTSKNLVFSFNAATTEKIIHKGSIVRLIQ